MGDGFFFLEPHALIRDHPRLRGEYDAMKNYPGQHCGSPPLARGIRRPHKTRKGANRITPACAGNTAPLQVLQLESRDHPRLRGEYIMSNMLISVILGSPPLARGIHPQSTPW